MAFPEVGVQGLRELRGHRSSHMEGVIEGPLARVPQALVRYTLYWVLEAPQGGWGYGYQRGGRGC